MILSYNRCPPLLDACGESPEEGYTAKYTPVKGTSLAEPYESALIIGIDADVDTTQALDCSLFVGEFDRLFSWWECRCSTVLHS